MSKRYRTDKEVVEQDGRCTLMDDANTLTATFEHESERRVQTFSNTELNRKIALAWLASQCLNFPKKD